MLILTRPEGLEEYQPDAGKIKIKGIIEEEAKIYRILIKTNICKKGE